MWSLILLIVLVVVVNVSTSEDRACLTSCAKDYTTQLDSMSVKNDLSLRLDVLNQVCKHYQPARQCALTNCTSASKKLYTLYFDMDVPCDDKYRSLFIKNAKCMSLTMRSEWKCKRECRKDGSEMASQLIDNNPHYARMDESDVKQHRELITNCHMTECLTRCLESDFEKNCKTHGGDAKVAEGLHKEWQRSLLASRYLNDKTEETPAACDWAKEDEKKASEGTGKVSTSNVVQTAGIAGARSNHAIGNQVCHPVVMLMSVVVTMMMVIRW